MTSTAPRVARVAVIAALAAHVGMLSWQELSRARSAPQHDHEGMQHAPQGHEKHRDERGTPPAPQGHEKRRDERGTPPAPRGQDAPAHDEEAHPRSEVHLEPRGARAIGVRIEEVRRESLAATFRAVAVVVPDESRVSHVHTLVSGVVERLFVSTTGAEVRAGQALFGIFSPELFAAQAEYLAVRGAASPGLPSTVAFGARRRLKLLGMSESEVRAIEASGEPRRLVTVHAPRPGIVLRRSVALGARVEPGSELVLVADLSRVWVVAEIPASDLESVSVGASAMLELPASGLAPFESHVEYVAPTLTESTATLRVRFAADNAGGALRPGSFGTATFRGAPRTGLTASRDAIVDTGKSRHVFVVAGEHHYVPRRVRLGAIVGERVLVLEGLDEGEAIVASGVFLLDSESRLRATGGGHAHMHAPTSTEPEPAHHH